MHTLNSSHPPFLNTVTRQAEAFDCHLSLQKAFGHPFTQSVDPFHHRLLNRLQKADPYDPWLQRAWAVVLRATGRAQEAAAHAQAALGLFHQAAERALGGKAQEVEEEEQQGAGDEASGATVDGTPPLGLDGRPLAAAGLIAETRASIEELVRSLGALGLEPRVVCASLRQYEDAAFGSLRALVEGGRGEPGMPMLLDAQSTQLLRFAEGLGCAAGGVGNGLSSDEPLGNNARDEL